MALTELIIMTLTVAQSFFFGGGASFMPNFNQVGHKMYKMGHTIFYNLK